MANHEGSGLMMDARGLAPECRSEILFGVVDQFVRLGCEDSIIYVSDHEPAGVAYQVDLRRESRGRFRIDYSQRSDGAWVTIFTPNR